MLERHLLDVVALAATSGEKASLLLFGGSRGLAGRCGSSGNGLRRSGRLFRRSDLFCRSGDRCRGHRLGGLDLGLCHRGAGGRVGDWCTNALDRGLFNLVSALLNLPGRLDRLDSSSIGRRSCRRSNRSAQVQGSKVRLGGGNVGGRVSSVSGASVVEKRLALFKGTFRFSSSRGFGSSERARSGVSMPGGQRAEIQG